MDRGSAADNFESVQRRAPVRHCLNRPCRKVCDSAGLVHECRQGPRARVDALRPQAAPRGALGPTLITSTAADSSRFTVGRLGQPRARDGGHRPCQVPRRVARRLLGKGHPRPWRLWPPRHRGHDLGYQVGAREECAVPRYLPRLPDGCRRVGAERLRLGQWVSGR